MFGAGSKFFETGNNPLGIQGANNGLSVSGTGLSAVAQLGQAVGASGNPAQLLNNRVIPMNGFSITYSGIGQTTAGQLIFQQSSTIGKATPVFVFQTSAGAEVCRLTVNNDDIYFGQTSGASVTSTGLQNACFGFNSGNLITSGIRNTLLGSRAGQSITTGGPNTFVGQFSGGNNATGSNNVAVGGQCLAGSGNYTNSTAVGQGAMTNTVANDSTAIGANAYGGTVTPGGANQVTAVGSGAAQQYPVGINDSFFGYKCGFNMDTSGGANTLAGALTQSTTVVAWGSGNSVYGYNINATGGFSVGSNNNWFGANITWTATVSNATVIGQGMTIGQSNVVRLGRADQTVIVGSTADIAASGATLQVLGTIQTSAPVTTASKVQFGTVVATAIVVNLTQYLEINYNGTTHKVVTAD